MKNKLQDILIKQAGLASGRAEKAKTSTEFLDYIKSLEVIYKLLVSEKEFIEANCIRDTLKKEIAEANLRKAELEAKNNICG